MRRSLLKKAIILGPALLLWSDSVSGQGFRLEGQQLTVARARDWNGWSLGNLQEPVGSVRQDIVDITSEGLVLPRFFRKKTDAVSNAPHFKRELDKKLKDLFVNTSEEEGKLFVRGGIKDAGSNVAGASNIMDRDDDRFESYWEPDPNDPLDEWWVEIDLGRMVSAERIVLRFVQEGKGDPFLQFRVLVSNGEFAHGYRIVGGTTRGIRDQRLFEYVLEPDRVTAPDYTGTPLQFVTILVTDSRKGRAEEISAEEYADLDPADQGAVDYYLKSLDGGRIRADDREEWKTADPARQDTVLYHRRERPRLADVEVFTVGDNIALGISQRGGKLTIYGSSALEEQAFDGDAVTVWAPYIWAEVYPAVDRGAVLTADLGTSFWMDTIRIISTGNDPDRDIKAIYGYVARISDGSRASNDSLIWNQVSPVEREDFRTNNISDVYFEERFEPRPIRFFEFKHYDGGVGKFERGAFREIQLFGQGYVPEVVLTSPLIEFKDAQGRKQARNLSRVEWSGDSEPGTRIEIRTRTGNELISVWHYFKKGNLVEVSKEQYYNKLLASQRGDSLETVSPGVDWGPWSNAYEHSGDPFLSPSPRRYLQIQASLLSTRADAFATLDSLIVHFTDPLARQLLAEVTPRMEVRSAEVDTFSLYVRSLFVDEPEEQSSRSFDEIRAVASQGTEMELIEVRVGRSEALLEGGGEVFTADGQGGFVNAAGDGLELRQTGTDTLWIKLPGLVGRDAEGDPLYQRTAQDGDEAPLSKTGRVLSRQEWALLPEAERGRIDYFEVAAVDSLTGAQTLQRVDKDDYDQLEFEVQGPVRYFRRLFAGEEVSLDNDGEPLTRGAYNRLGNRKGPVLREGEVVELRFSSRIFVKSASFSAEVANSAEPGSWQTVDPGDAMERIEGEGTAVSTPITGRIIHRLGIAPNPFTPNGDGINDRVRLVLSVLNIDTPRRIEARFFTLNGVEVATRSKLDVGGERVLEWDGRNAAGEPVPPGLYLCRVHVDADVGSNSAVRVVGVAY